MPSQIKLKRTFGVGLPDFPPVGTGVTDGELVYVYDTGDVGSGGTYKKLYIGDGINGVSSLPSPVGGQYYMERLPDDLTQEGVLAPRKVLSVNENSVIDRIQVGNGLSVSGVSTFYSDVRIEGDLTITDDLVFDEFEARQFVVTGVGTINEALSIGATLSVPNAFINAGIITDIVGTAATITTIDANAADIVTATIGSGIVTDIQVSGAATVSGNFDLDSDLHVTGISTFVGITTQQSTLFANQVNVSGVSTFYDDIQIHRTDGNIRYLSFYDVNGNSQGSVLTAGNDGSGRLEVNGQYLLRLGATGDVEITDGAYTSTKRAVFGDAGVELYSGVSTSSTKKFETLGVGVTVYGNTETQTLNVTGVSTVVGVATFQNDVYIDGNLNVVGDVVYDEVVGRNINITGVGTIENLIAGVATVTTLYSTDLNLNAGVITSITGTYATITNLVGTAATIDTLDIPVNLDVDGHTELDNANVSGIITVSSLSVDNNFDVYDLEAEFHNDVHIHGNLSVAGTFTNINQFDLFVESKDIVLGVTTNSSNDDISNDNTANGGGIAIASTEGSPLVNLTVSGVTTTDILDQYKQIMWFKHNTFGVGTTDAFLFNYAVGVGSTNVPNQAYMAVGNHVFYKNVFESENLDVLNADILDAKITAGIITDIVGTAATITTIDINAADIVTATIGSGIVTDIQVSGASTVTGIATFQNDVYIAGNLNVIGDVVYDEVVGRNINITGVGTIENLNAGVATITTLQVTGISTFSDDIDVNADIAIDGSVNATGIVTALRFETTTTGDTNSFYAGGEAGLTADVDSEDNVMIGYRAGYDLSLSDHNIGIGREVFSSTSNSSSFGNIALGGFTLQSITGGDYNFGAGYGVLSNVTSATGNVAAGAFSMNAQTTGNYNTAYGYDALRTTTERAGNVALGAFALRDSFNADYAVAIGYEAGRDSETDNTVLIGRQAGRNASGYGGIAIGYAAGYDLEGNYNVMLGSYTGYSLNNGGSYNVGLGYAALYQDAGAREFNIGIGYYALLGNSATSTGDYNIAIGREAGELLSSGGGNVFIGNYAGEDVTTGNNNVILKATSTNYADIDTTKSEQLWIGYEDKAWITGVGKTTTLRYDNADRLDTTIYGIDVTGHTETDTLNVSGVGTIANFNSGLGTITTLHSPSAYINAGVITSIIGTAATITNIDSDTADIVTATIGAGIITDIQVSGASTVTGIATFQSDIFVAGNLNVAGDIVYDEVVGRNIFISGVGTFANIEIGTASTNTINSLTGALTLDSEIGNNVAINTHTNVVGFLSASDGIYYDLGDFNGPNGIAYFDSSGLLVSSGATTASISTSNYLVTTDASGIPVWTNVFDGGSF